MRAMSFAATTAQILDQSKTVTRRTGWKNLKPGDRLWAVEKAMGLKKGEKHNRLAVIEVVDVYQERLDKLTETINGGQRGATVSYYAVRDVKLEGFADMTPAEFVDMFCAMNRCGPEVEVTRIEFKYVQQSDDDDVQQAVKNQLDQISNKEETKT